MRKWLFFAFVAAGLLALGYFDWQESIPGDATYIHIGLPILHHTWTCTDGGTGCTSTTTRHCSTSTATCNVTVASTAGGSVGTLCENMSGTTNTFSSASGGGTWVVDTASLTSNATSGIIECGHNVNMTAATTTVTCNFTSAAAGNQCSYFNFTGTGSSFTFDTAASVSDATCTSCAGAALSLGTANNYILIQGVSCGGTCSAIDQSYTGAFFNGDGMAYKINVSTAGTTPNWTMTSSKASAGGLAIYEVVGGAVAGFNKRKKLEKLGI